MLITGATDGLGRALARAADDAGATVLVHGRSNERIAETLGELSDRARAYRADLASLAEVERLAGEVLAAEDRLDVLVNNAGIGASVPGGGARQESADGYELRFAVNYLAGYALPRRLLDLLRRSAPSRRGARSMDGFAIRAMMLWVLVVGALAYGVINAINLMVELFSS